MMSRYLTVIVAVLAAAVCALWGRNRGLESENERLAANNAALRDRGEYYRTEAGRSAASVQRLVLTCDELEESYRSVCKQAEDLGVQVKRMQAAATTATRTDVKVVTQVRDSIVYRDGAADSLRAFSWQDAWVSVAGVIRDREVELDVSSCDTVVQIVHRVPKRFWFIKWGCKAIRQEIVSTNPHTKIAYTEYIELK